MNRSETAAECARRLATQSVRLGKLYVTDNASCDDTVEAVRSTCAFWDLSLELFQSEVNIGNAGGIQVAIDRAFLDGYDAVWILDDDSLPEEGALAALLDPEGPEGGIRGSTVLTDDSGRLSWPCEVPNSYGAWSLRTEPTDSPNWQPVRRSWLGILLPREAFIRIGSVNGAFFLRGEDEDYPRRLQHAGYRFWMARRSILRHPASGELATISFAGQKVCLERHLDGNRLYYRIRNMVWIKNQESGRLAASALVIAYLLLILAKFRPLRSSLSVFCEAVKDAVANKLGNRRG